MTNHEKIKNMSTDEMAKEIDRIASSKCEFCINRPLLECWDMSCINGITAWLEEECKEKTTLSDAERVILENIDKDYKWIARDKDNSLWLYGDIPIKKSACWSNENSEIGEEFAFYKHIFQFITWQDDEPYNIEELLKGE